MTKQANAMCISVRNAERYGDLNISQLWVK